MKKGKYLITGCAGFIGSNLVKKMHKNYELILVDDLSEGSVLNLPKELRKKLIKRKIQDIKKLKTKKLSNPITLELSKIICDTSYYGWLINYAQMSKMIAKKYKVDYDEMWSFSDEIHKFLGNRPKMFPGFIGGHCVIPNLQLIDEHSLNQINDINNMFKKFLKK